MRVMSDASPVPFWGVAWGSDSWLGSDREAYEDSAERAFPTVRHDMHVIREQVYRINSLMLSLCGFSSS